MALGGHSLHLNHDHPEERQQQDAAEIESDHAEADHRRVVRIERRDLIGRHLRRHRRKEARERHESDQ
jgi:hypothetical protein